MQKIFNFIVDKRYFFLVFFLILTGFSVFLMGRVNVNDDLTKYLPKDSPTLAAVNISNDQFGYSSSLKVVFEGLTDSEINSKLTELKAIQNVSSVDYDSTPSYNKGGYSLFVLHIPFMSTSLEANDVLSTVETNFPASIVGGQVFTDNQPIIPPYLIVLAFIILMVILFLFTSSWIEPILFIFTIGLAVIINLGTNVIFSSISSTTHSIAALLQLCLSIDYSIMLLNRYRQEKKKEINKVTAMKTALRNSFSSISGSSLTTIAGLLCLLFMSFKVGADMGLVLAKGVFISLLIVFFVLPTVILMFDKVIDKTNKWSLHFKVHRLSNFSYKARKVIPIIIIFVFAGSFYLRGNIQTSYVLPVTSSDRASEIFPDNNTVVLLYENKDEQNTLPIIQSLKSNSNVLSVTSFSTTIGAQLTPTQLSQTLGIDETQVSALLSATSQTTMSLYDFINLVLNNYSSMLTSAQLQQLNGYKIVMDNNYSQLVGSEYSRMIISTDYPPDSNGTFAFIDSLKTEATNDLTGNTYFLGNSVMAEELSSSFSTEFITITILTILAIFIIVAITFKSIAIPTILVTIIQTAIFLSMGALGTFGSDVYFLALIVVQAILMGATIDYGILLTSYFREAGKDAPVKEAIEVAYKGAIHTILTSGSILFFVTALLGVVATNPTINQVLRALAIGSASATLLILFVLPSVLVFIHKYVIKNVNQIMKRINRKNGN